MPGRTSWILKLSEHSFLKRIEQLPTEERHAALWLRMREDPEFFARQLFPAYCRLPFAEHHRLLFQWHREMDGALPRRRGLRFVLAAPRGAAKSTIASLILPLHDIAFARERYILLLSATERQATQRLRAIRREIERGAIAPWIPSGEKRFSLRSLITGETQIDAFGAGTEIRGISHGAFRPTKIILDDAESSRSAESPKARQRLAAWFTEVIEHLGDRYTHMVVIGTVLHEKALLATLLQRPDFTGFRARSIISFAPRQDLWNQWRHLLLDLSDPQRRERARAHFEQHRHVMEKGAQVLWPEKEDYEELMAQLTLQGRRAFYREKQNTPLGPEEALFDPQSALRAVRDGEALILQTIVEGQPVTVRVYREDQATGRRFGYLDAALGKGRTAGRGDFAALAAVLLLHDGTFVLETLWARRASPSEQVRQLFERHEHAPFERLAIEGTGFQELLTIPVEEERQRRRAAGQRADLPIEIVKPRRNKAARIAAIEPLLANGTLALSPHLDEEFWEELATYPLSHHDDALDAAAGAIELARKFATTTGIHWERRERTKTGRLRF